MSGSLFREWRVAMAFVAGVAILAGAFVSDEGEHRYFDRFKPREAAVEEVAAPAAAVVHPVVQPARANAAGGFSSDAELEDAFTEPDPGETIAEAGSVLSGALGGEPDASADAANPNSADIPVPTAQP